jgi:hypothetical protein
MAAHRRQFVIGPAPVLVDADWTSVTLLEGLHLSHHHALPVATVQDRDGGDWHLLGIAVQTDPARAAPTEEVATARRDEVAALTSSWAGRWLLLGDGILRTDACGLLGCFYAQNPSDGKLVVSSSAALISDLVGADVPSPPLRHAVGMDWYPPPASRFAGMSCLLPSQTLALNEAHNPVRHRWLVSPRVAASYDETLAYLETSLRTALRNLALTGQPLWLGLTGGYDSRLLLAAMLREGLEFTTFTHELSGMSNADRILPPLLARDAGVSHRTMKRQRFDAERLRTFDEHTALHTVELDRELYPWGQYDELPIRSIFILTTVMEVGGLYYHEKLALRADDVVRSVQNAFGFTEHHADSPAHREGIREWAKWIDIHPEPGMDWRDRFYLEQRAAGWAGSFLQGLDLVEIETVSPVNCESVLAAMLQIDPALRRGKRWEVDLAYRMAPFVTDHPYALGGPLATRLRRGASGWVRHPSKRRFAVGRMRSLAARTRAAQASLLL